MDHWPAVCGRAEGGLAAGGWWPVEGDGGLVGRHGQLVLPLRDNTAVARCSQHHAIRSRRAGLCSAPALSVTSNVSVGTSLVLHYVPRCAALCCAVPCRAVPCRAVPCRAVLCCAVARSGGAFHTNRTTTLAELFEAAGRRPRGDAAGELVFSTARDQSHSELATDFDTPACLASLTKVDPWPA